VLLDGRVVEFPWLHSQLPRGRGGLLDAGSAVNFRYFLSNAWLAAKQIFLSTLEPESPWQRVRPNASHVYEDQRDTRFQRS